MLRHWKAEAEGNDNFPFNEGEVGSMRMRTQAVRIGGIALGWLIAWVLWTGVPAGHAAEATALKGKEATSSGLIQVGADPILFALRDLDGQVIKLEDYVGKQAVLLTFWSFFCGPCREEMPLLDQLFKKYQPEGLVMLGINLDGPKLEKAVRRYMESNGFTFQVLWEQIEGIRYKTADAYGVAGTPTMVLIGRNGKVAWTHVGREAPQKIEEAIRKALASG